MSFKNLNYSAKASAGFVILALVSSAIVVVFQKSAQELTRTEETALVHTEQLFPKDATNALVPLAKSVAQNNDMPSAMLRKASKQQRIDQAFRDRELRTLDPALGYAPSNRLMAAVEVARRKQAALWEDPEKNLGIAAARWRERGPNNLGGRSRALLVDANDPTGKRIWAGSVSGGLWFCSDITAPVTAWRPVNDYFPNLAVMDIVQASFNPNLMFFCTGEFASVRGIGVFRSTDGGQSWQHLPATSNFQYTYKMLLHPGGDVYVTTNRGVWRSQDSGETWARVIGSGTSNVSAGEFFDIEFSSDNQIFVSSNNAIFKSASGNIGTWTSITNSPGGPPGISGRLEFDVAPSNPEVIYALNDVGGDVEGIYRTNNGGLSWTKTAMPNALGMANFARGQAWYDLEITIHPTNPNRVIVGGIDLHMTTNGGAGWTQISQWFGGGGIQYVHADQHRVIYDPNNSNVIYFLNDGGVYRTQSGNSTPSQVLIQDRNISYNTSQFYAGAIHPEAGKNYAIGGTQDNGSIAISDFGVSNGRSVLGGDGFFCHIDQDQPNIQMVSLYYAQYSLSTDGGRTFSGGAALNGNFLSASDYDSRSNILYSQTRDADFYRWSVNTGATEPVDVVGFNLAVAAVTVDPNIPNRVYFGNFSNGRIIRVDNAHTGAEVVGVALSPLAGTISSIAVEDGDPNHLLVTVSNYGLPSVFESFDGGQSWINVEGDLPDMPVNFCIFNPRNNRQAMLATEAGVWVTALLEGSSTQWLPPLPGRGIPFVRTDMLRIRKSDNVVLAATHGRGMFSCDVFAEPAARMDFSAIAYTNAPIRFSGAPSTNADSYFWSFGDGATDTLENPVHTYAAIGQYPISLTINNSLNTNSTIKILPDRPTPWNSEKPEYGGDFEGFEQQYGVHTISGSAFSRGRSNIAGKDGVKSGQNAFVVGIDEPFYQANTHTMLYLPNFDFSAQSIYEFSFWGKWRIHPGFDGFRIEYSTNRGQSWQVLGDAVQPGWYNQRNNNLPDAVFPEGTSYFSGNRSEFQRYRLNISFLSGSEDVAFRVVFRSDGVGSHVGVVLDDFRVDKYEGELITQLIRFEGVFTSGATAAKLDWTTEPEYFCKRIEVERSLNGRDFERIAIIDATGGRTLEPQVYSHTSLAQRNLYFYRLKVINEEPSINYQYTFYSNVIALQRNPAVSLVSRIFPSPASSSLGVTFNGVLETPLDYEIFDAAGRLVLKGRRDTPGAYFEIDLNGNFPTGMYILRITTGERSTESFKFAISSE
jgi:hypothetical protein